MQHHSFTVDALPCSSSQAMPARKTNSASGHSTAALPTLPGHQVNHCFACGPANEYGLHLRFVLDVKAGTATARFLLTRRFEGPPGHIHGGIIATLLDEAMGKVNKLKNVVALTRHMDVDYLRPVPLRQPLTVVGSTGQSDGRKHHNQAEILNAAGEVLARSRGLFIAIDPVAMFAKYGTAGTGKDTSAAVKTRVRKK